MRRRSCSPSASTTCAADKGPALVRLTVPRLCSHSGPDNQKGYRTEAEIAADVARDPLPKLRAYLVPALMSAEGVEGDSRATSRAMWRLVSRARARGPRPTRRTSSGSSTPRNAGDGDAETTGGLSPARAPALGGTDEPNTEGDFVRFAEAVRRTLARELEVERTRRSSCSARTWARRAACTS